MKKSNLIICSIVLLMILSVFTVFSFASDPEIINLIKKLGESNASAAIEQLAEKKEKALVSELFSALGDSNVLMRKNAGAVLERIGKPAITGLSEVLKDSNVNDTVKDYALTILGKINDDTIIPIFIDVLSVDKANLRNSAIALLRNRGDAVLPYLRNINYADLNARRCIPLILSNMKTPEATKMLFEMFNVNDVEIRITTAYTMSKIATPEAVTLLAKKVIDKDEDIEVKKASAISLKAIKTKEAFIAIIDIFRQPGAYRSNCSCEHDKKPIIPILLGDFPIYIKEDILNAGYEDSFNFINDNLDVVLKIARDDKEKDDFRYLMMDLIDSVLSEKSASFLIEAFEYGTKYRIMAISSLLKMQEKAAPYLYEFMQNDKSDYFLGTLSEIFYKMPNHSKILYSLYKYEKSTPAVKKRIIKISISNDDMNVLAAITTEAKGEDQKFITDTIANCRFDNFFINILVLKEPEFTELKISAFNYLSKLKSDKAIPYIFPFFTVENEKVRETAKQTVISIANKNNTALYTKEYLTEKQTKEVIEMFRGILVNFGKDIVPILIENLNNTDKNIQKEVFEIISLIGPASAPELIKAIENQNKAISSRSIALLKKMDYSIIPEVIKSLNSTNNLVIFTAKEIIIAQGDVSIPYLKEGLKNNDDSISINCAELLADKKQIEPIPFLIDFLASDNKTYQIKAIFTLVKYKEAVIPPLNKEWEKKNAGGLAVLLRIFSKKHLNDKQLKDFNSNTAKTLFTIGSASVDSLISMADKYKNIDEKLEIFKYLKNIKDKKASPFFIKNLAGVDSNLILASIEGLVSLKEKEAVEPLKKVIQNTQDLKIKQAAILAVKQISEEKF
ncbi:HEAT repeat domain-containing protein [Candidatus Desantisbacteria bacterium]|nr:HEAT repeat domain-containing protein [Candidatus Desantisbacteria bacterium]